MLRLSGFKSATRIVGVAFLFLSLFSISSLQAREIVNPDKRQIDLLYRYLASDPPDFASEAKKSYEVRSANEFDRPNIARQIENTLRRDFDLMKDVDVIRIRTRARLSEYDSDRGGFYISSLKPGSYFKFGKIQLAFENADHFHLWDVAVGDARYTVEKIGYGRDVIIDIRTRPFAIDAARGKRLRTQIIGLDIYSKKTNEQFASLSLPEGQFRTIKIAGLEQSSTLTSDKLNVLGLSHDMGFDLVADWGIANGYAIFAFEDKGVKPRTSQGGADLLKTLAQKSYHTPDLYLSSDQRSFKFKTISTGFGGSEFEGGARYSIFGSKLDCLSPQNLGVKCAMVEFDDTYEGDERHTALKRITFVQNAYGVTREQITAKLTEKYGPPSDNISTTVFDQYRSNLLIWGRSRQNSGNENQMYFSRVAWTQTWEVEAYIVEPDGQRIAIVTIINVIPPDKSGTVSGGKGQINF